MYSAGIPGSSSGPAGLLASKAPEELSVLHRRLADESSDRDAAKAALQKISRSVDFYRQRLSSLTGTRSGGTEVARANLQRVRDVLLSLESEMRTVPTSDQALQELHVIGQSPRQGYDVLRQSLEETQRRCESLNCDMFAQSEANEELVETLNTVKDANKRLLEQSRFQTDEIAQLTQQRIGDEERMDRLTKKHQADHEAFRQNLQRNIATIRSTASDDFGKCSRRLVDKLRYLRTRVEIIGQDAGRLLQEQQRLKMDVATMVDAMQSQLHTAERDVAARCSHHVENCLKRQQASEEAVADLEAKLAAEKDLRHNEGLSWHHKHDMLLAEQEDVQGRTSRDASQRTSCLQSLERALTAERHGMAVERTNAERQHDEVYQQYLSCQSENDKLQRDCVRLETSCDAAECEIRSKEQIVAELRRNVRESDDALAAAVNGNEHLRQQMEEQRNRAQEKNEADLSDARASCDQKLNDARMSQDSNVAMASRQLQDMEETVAKDEETLQALRAQVSVVASDLESLGRDGQMWKTQYEAAKTSRCVAEKEFKEARQNFASERLKLQAAIDRLSSHTTSTEDEIMRTWDHIEEFRRLSGARETEQITRTGAAEALVREAQEQLTNLKKRMLETLDNHARADAELCASRQRAIEVQTVLEQDLDNRRKSAEDEKLRLQEQLDAEQRATGQSREQLEREKETSLAMLRRVQEESRSKLGATERERVRIEETCRADTAGACESVAQQQKYTDALEHDLHRLRYLLTESEANLSWVRQEMDREEREASHALRQLQTGAQSISSELEKATKTESSMVRQIEETTQRNRQEQVRMAKELEALRRSSAAEVADTDVKLNRARAELELDLRTNEDRHRSVLVVDKAQEEALERENSQLKSFLAEHNSTSGGLSQLHNKLETHIQRLQKHTEDLRRDIHGSSTVGPREPITTNPRPPPATTQNNDPHPKSPRRAGSLAAAALSPRALSPTQALLHEGDSELRLELRAQIGPPSASVQGHASPRLVGSSNMARAGDLSGLGTTF